MWTSNLTEVERLQITGWSIKCQMSNFNVSTKKVVFKLLVFSPPIKQPTSKEYTIYNAKRNEIEKIRKILLNNKKLFCGE